MGNLNLWIYAYYVSTIHTGIGYDQSVQSQKSCYFTN